MLKKSIILAIIGLLLCLTFIEAKEQWVIIANKDVPIESISKKDLKKIFMGRKKLWSNNLSIGVSYLNQTSSSESSAFLREVVGISIKKFERHWLKQVLTGNAFPPETYVSPRQVITFVTENPGGIGLIPSSAVDTTSHYKIVIIRP